MSMIETVLAYKGAIAFGAGCLGLLVTAGVGGMVTMKKVSPVSWGWYGAVNETDGIALGGTDVVSYHEGSEAKGVQAHSTDWNGSTWRFESEEHRALFAASPERYAPAYGGFCGFAVSKGFTAVTESNAFHVEGEQLYLFADTAMRDNWLGDKDNALAAGQANWATRK